MEDDGRKKKGVFGGPPKKRPSDKPKSKEMLERNQQRRPLRTYPLSPPDYLIDPQVLLQDYVEKDLRFAGIIPNVPVHLDSTSRTDILRVIDRGKKDGTIPWHTTYEQDAIFSLSVNNIKISRRDGNEELMLRVPIHEIATICYIQDDASFILILKFGNPEESREMCKLAVFLCDSRSASEELCSLVGQCFQLVYTDATMQFFDRKVNEGARGVSGTSSVTLSSDYSTSTPKNLDKLQDPSFLSQSALHLDHSQTSTLNRPAHRRKRSTTQSVSDLSTSAADLLHDYIRKMQRVLTDDELKRFASLCKMWQENMPFNEYCQRVLELYGQERKYLLADMRDFIPEKDYEFFESFLKSIGIVNNGRGSQRSRYRRTASDVSGLTTGSASDTTSLAADEFDRSMNIITSSIANMETSVNINPSSYLGMQQT
ncbi:cerebral cavernous malformations protein 2 homolog isoform X2 [Lingula anatina]|uniref:Cerebral cavernous malformations protein 2 homolog isoform X2 n=1 Tax=Lingula anatina TaxID=7574 RepID=A0A1S3K7V7_LINAN|nr:cerebral cavernous malformations protein 2 homolog isoform X2 [Lingula anatina]|eukprot:XP_013418720.1 cerebral cavernous malformations protein 2 homolog isoform X2 [Lingula anatina]